MPLILHEKLHEHSSWALWHIEEDLAALQGSLHSEQLLLDQPVDSKPKKQRLEWLASRLLIRQLAEEHGLYKPVIVKDEFGKPFLHHSPFQISLSHSFPYAAAIIHQQQPVGIDIEMARLQLSKVAPRILHPEELSSAGNELKKLCIYWAAKEALYKCYGRRGLIFKEEILIEPFQLQQEGLLRGRIHTSTVKKEYTLHYRHQNELLICFSL